MRRGLLVAGIAVVVVLAAAATYLALIDVNQFRPQIQAAIEKQLGRSVQLGTMSLRLIPFSIRIENVSVGEDPTFPTGRPFATAGEVRASVALLPLIRKELQVRSFVLENPSIELVQDAAGRWNFSSLGGGGGKEGGGGLSIKELSVENGKVAVSELGKSRSVYDRVNIRLEDFAPRRPFRLTLAAALPGAPPDSLRLEASGGPLGDPGSTLSGAVHLKKADTTALRQFMGKGAAAASAIIDGNIPFSMKNGIVDARPALSFESLKVNGRDLGKGARVDGELQDDTNSGILKIPSLKVTAGGVPVGLSGQVNTRASTLDITARAKGASISELLALAAAMGATEVAGSGTLDLDVRVQGPMDRTNDLRYFGQGSVKNASFRTPDLTAPVDLHSANLKFNGNVISVDGLAASLAGSNLRGAMTVENLAAPAATFNLEVDKLDFGQMEQLVRENPNEKKAARQSTPAKSTFSAKGTLSAGRLSYNGIQLDQVKTECTYANNVLTLAPLTAQVYGGSQSGAVTLDMRHSPATVALNTRLDSVNADKLLSATTSLKDMLYGLLSASGNATMSLLPGNEAARSLNGDLVLKLTKGRIAGINLMNGLASVARFAGFAQNTKPFTDVVGLAGNIQVRNGIANTNNLVLQTPEGSVGAAGTVNLVDQSLNLRLTAVLDRATTQQVGGSQVGGYLTTALVNNKGEMVIPAIVTGTFAKPNFAPDAARFAEMKLKNVLPSAGNMGSAASGIIGLLEGDKGAGRSILDSITGGKPAQNPQQPAGAAPAQQPQGNQQQPAQQQGAQQQTPQQQRRGLLGGVLEQLQKQRQQQKPPAQPGTNPPPKQ